MIHIITGQTATGKTAYALELARKLDGELINADSRQIYKRLDIITGKDLDLTDGTFIMHKQYNGLDIGYYGLKAGSRIWLYDILPPNKPFSAFEFVGLATQVIEDIQKRGKTPIIVGGTFFYIQQLLYGTSDFQVEPDQTLRSELNEKTVHELQKILREKNPDLFLSLNNSEKHNPQRLIRKIEIETHMKGGSAGNPNEPWNENDFSLVGFIYENKEDLRVRITERVEKRLQQGAIDEVKTLLDSGFQAQDPGMRTIGYAQVIEYLEGSTDKETMKERWISKEMQYAKRQLTLMKKDQHIRWEKV
ncbi:tRNA dimethylallyltransferase [Candidatus Roizmanbacteria bacterium]|nr:MAG: tRNA dimethylallyltransferase [Candidatus Roizmanbacteria bacterium]